MKEAQASEASCRGTEAHRARLFLGSIKIGDATSDRNQAGEIDLLQLRSSANSLMSW